MKAIFTILLALTLMGMVIVIIAFTRDDSSTSVTQISLTPTPYHEGFPSPAASLTDDMGNFMPLPSAQDRATQYSMTSAGIAMTEVAKSMETAAAVMVASGNETLVELGEHWYTDARAMRDQGAWMILTATSESMVHDQTKAMELNLVSFQANGEVMQVEGGAMLEHVNAMLAQVDQLRTDGTLSATVADDLTTRGNNLITASEQMVAEGKTMEAEADRLIKSLGL